MKCISLWQPWATLMAIGAKKIETRSWPTRHRGPLAIHAAKKWNKELSEMCGAYPFSDALWQPGLGMLELPFGAIVCVVHLDDCVGTDRILFADDFFPLRTPIELAFGEYSAGRYGWITSSVRRLPRPIPFVGKQGLFDVPDAILGDLADFAGGDAQ